MRSGGPQRRGGRAGSSGTPRMIAFIAVYTRRDALARRYDDGGHQPRVILDRGEEVAHLVLLVEHVVREEQAAGREAGQHQVEEGFVVALPRVHEDEIERPVEPRDLLERVPRHDGDDVGEAGRADVRGRDPGARRIELDARQAPAGLAQAEAHPDRAVAERAADLEDALRPARRDHDAKEPSVFLGDAQQPGVGGLDLLEDTLHVGRLCVRPRRAHQDREQRRQPRTTRKEGHRSSHAAACLAVARPSATQSGMPTPRKPLPVR